MVQAVVESSFLFDCNVRPWLQGDIKKMQGMVDKCYRSVWNHEKVLRMHQEGVNSYGLRRELGIDSLRLKIEKRTLERVGHV